MHLAPGAAVIEAIEAGERPRRRRSWQVTPSLGAVAADRMADPMAPAGAASRALLDPGRVIDHPLERRLYARDGSIAQGDCGLVVLPETTAEVVACVRLARELGLPVVPARVGHRASAAARCRSTARSCCRSRA